MWTTRRFKTGEKDAEEKVNYPQRILRPGGPGGFWDMKNKRHYLRNVRNSFHRNGGLPVDK
jgi:hypothetical protein